jgi:hypothetical protein
MEPPITVGARVRVKEGSRAQGAQPGDTGTVVLVTVFRPDSSPLYHVRLDPPHGPGLVSFYPEEVEAAG